jgi:hypothetical protein
VSATLHTEPAKTRDPPGGSDSYLNERLYKKLVSSNIKMDLRETGFGDVDWIHWAQDRNRWRALVNTVMNLQVP